MLLMNDNWGDTEANLCDIDGTQMQGSNLMNDPTLLDSWGQGLIEAPDIPRADSSGPFNSTMSGYIYEITAPRVNANRSHATMKTDEDIEPISLEGVLGFRNGDIQDGERREKSMRFASMQIERSDDYNDNDNIVADLKHPPPMKTRQFEMQEYGTGGLKSSQAVMTTRRASRRGPFPLPRRVDDEYVSHTVQKNEPSRIQPNSTQAPEQHVALSHEVPWVDEPQPEDVLYGRGGKANHHPGNKRYLDLKERMKARYRAVAKKEKAQVSQELVDAVRDWGGRFLKQEVKDGSWFVVPDAVARKKAGQALREDNTPESRKRKRDKYGK